MAEFGGMLDRARARGPMQDAPMAFVVAVVNSLAETTMDFMASDPACAEEHSRSGFAALCGMLGVLIFLSPKMTDQTDNQAAITAAGCGRGVDSHDQEHL